MVANNFGRVPETSANWNNGSNAGAFCLNLNNPASNSNVNIGLRLANV